ncbi:DUF3313 domain-containing protein [Agrobacterium pusense]|uniref:DUF3313 domain-containing protein n=1 Tax=Agrobacterium pusense TaxID=648995 RepID=UPI001C6E5318|nr:DUF3313 domain-containing protein [Agrobacterium pusense]MBW9060404.1 DUF3313 domain-containing protein [Agrobacterium pusense]
MKLPANSALVIFALSGLGGCTSVPLTEAGTLSSYAQLGPAKGSSTKSRTFVDATALRTVKTVAIEPARFSASAAGRVSSENDRNLVTNAIDRALCVGLSDKYQVVSLGEPADLVVRTVVTNLVPTNRTMAGVSTVTSLGTSVVLPVGLPRLPFGLGGLAVEAEAVDPARVQRAATVWSRGANSITNSARVSEVGDAYSIASSFGNYFSRMLATGKVPAGLSLSPPSGQRIQSALGGKPKHAACEAFGRAPGLAGAVASRIGAPPEWTDKARKPEAP